jgi:putative ABC transport system substrate-binding protein
MPDGYRHAAHQANLVLQGRKPSDVPYYQLTRFALTINLRTATAVGIAIAPSLLARADEVIE